MRTHHLVYSWDPDLRLWSMFVDGEPLLDGDQPLRFPTMLECEQFTIAECERREQAG